MKTSINSFAYKDFDSNIQNNNVSLNADNSCLVLFDNKSIFKEDTTQIMEWFCKDNKTYMVFRFGSYSNKDFWGKMFLVAQIDRAPYSQYRAPSISMIRQYAISEPDFQMEGSRVIIYSRPYNKKLEPLLSEICSVMNGVSDSGFFKIPDGLYFNAQVPADRSGFYKEWINGYLMSEKNYGDCSLSFAIKGVLLY